DRKRGGSCQPPNYRCERRVDVLEEGFEIIQEPRFRDPGPGVDERDVSCFDCIRDAGRQRWQAQLCSATAKKGFARPAIVPKIELVCASVAKILHDEGIPEGD